MCTVVACPVVTLFCKCCVWTLWKCFCSHGAMGKGQPRRKSRGSFKCQTHIRLMCEKYNQAEYTYRHHWSTEQGEEDSLGILRRLTLAETISSGILFLPSPTSSLVWLSLTLQDFQETSSHHCYEAAGFLYLSLFFFYFKLKVTFKRTRKC